ncbi:MAG: hypothetical protein JWR38_1716 [Mucilaginibacter sp.]|nr:hypothetical protein [Mucilaginibacter sp.]
MLLLGSKAPGRHTEQHDVFFGIAETLKDLVPEINAFWPEAAAISKVHVDAWREVTTVDGYYIEVENRTGDDQENQNQLFFINLGGYKQDLFDEPHFKILTVQQDKATAIKYSKTTEFYQQVHFAGAESHIDDKYGVDVDDLHQIDEILPLHQKEKFRLRITAGSKLPADEIHLGYFKLNSLP